jgi:hypothetical protein
MIDDLQRRKKAFKCKLGNIRTINFVTLYLTLMIQALWRSQEVVTYLHKRVVCF